MDVAATCPECGSKRVYLAGHRKLSSGSETQRFLCRDCGYRFSKHSNSSEPLNMRSASSPSSQICAHKVKNLATAQKTKNCAGDMEKLPQDARGLLTKYMAYLEREGYYRQSKYVGLLKSLVKDGADLLDPESVKTKIARHRFKNKEGIETEWKNSVKMLASYAYDAFCKMEGIEWTLPGYKQEESMLYVPDEKDLDQLISAAHSKRMATFLQLLKETWADPGELLRAEWIDLKDNVLAINHPVKGHLPGYSPQLSATLMSMLGNLPKNDKRIFATHYINMAVSFMKLRKRAAQQLQNPKLLSVSFKSFRHWGGSMLAHYTDGNVLKIQKALRHKSITNTMKYIHTLEFKDEDFEVTTATTVEQIMELGKAGWVKYDELTLNGAQIHCYRKPKRFSNLKG